MISYFTGAVTLGFGAILSILLCRKNTPKKTGDNVEYPLNKSKTETLPVRSKLSKELIECFHDGVHGVYETFAISAKQFADRDCQGTRKISQILKEKVIVDGKEKVFDVPEFEEMKYRNYAQVNEDVIAFGDGVVTFTGINSAKDNFGIYEETRAEWVTTYLAMARHGIPLATCYANLGVDALVTVINECELVALVCCGTSIKTLDDLKDKLPTLKYLIYTDKLSQESKYYKTLAFDDCIALGKKNPLKVTKKILPNTVCVNMYTSGSTGAPKGVMITHENIVSFCGAVKLALGIKHDDVYLGYLPLAHVLELAAESCFYFCGGAIGYGSPRTLTDRTAKPIGDIKAVRPTHMAGVPRVWETIRKGALEKIAGSGAIKKFLFETAYDQKVEAIKHGGDTPIWNKLVFSALREQLGGRMARVISGGAPLNAETQTFMRVCFDVSIIQGYGLTETTGGLSLQDIAIENFATGNVGYIAPSAEVKLISAEELNYLVTDDPPRGEVCVRGKNVCMGYYKNPKATKEAFDEDGWFKTGDIGRFNRDGTLSIIDRRKNLVKLSGGEYVALEHLEMVYGVSKFISPNGICLYADSTKDNMVACIVPQKSYVMGWASENGISGDYDTVLKSEKLKAAIAQQFKEIAAQHGKKSFEFVTVFQLFNEEWTPENGMLTAAMKLQRQNIAKHYQSNIVEMYKRK
jgi:long-chain acyl-CoA synthetase